MAWLFCCWFFTGCFIGFGQQQKTDFTKITAEIDINPYTKRVVGKVNYRFKVRKAVDSIYLNAVKMIFDELRLDGKPVKYVVRNDTLWLYSRFKKNSNHRLFLIYNAYPAKGMYFTGWQDKGRNQLWTQGQGIDNRYWLPCYDEQTDKVVFDLKINFDKNYQVLSNGKLVSEKISSPGTRQWHYRMKKPMSTYLLMIAVGDYRHKDSLSASGVPLQYWYYPEKEKENSTTYAYSGRIFDFLEREIGVAYPWTKYAQIPVKDFKHSGMENTTATVFDDRFVVNDTAFADQNYINVNAHELAHQWFGNFVTAKNSTHHWLHEGFATYYALLAERELFGADYFQWHLYQDALQVWTSPDTERIPLASAKAGYVLFYQKGAWVVHMLRRLLGDGIFRKGIRKYLTDMAYGIVTTDDLMWALEEVSGRKLRRFFDTWVYKASNPKLRVNYEEGTINFVNKPPFTVTFSIYYKGNRKKTIQADTTVRIPDKDSIDFIVPYENNGSLVQINFRRPLILLKNQALKAPHFIDRYKAVKQMRDFPLQHKATLFKTILLSDAYYPIKREVIFQLRGNNSQTADTLIKTVFDRNDPEVRQALAVYREKIPRHLKSQFESLLNDRSYVTIENALYKLCFNFPEDRKKYLKQVEGITGFNGRNIRMLWLALALSDRNTNIEIGQKYLNELVSYTDVSYNLQTRLNAFGYLKELNYFDMKALKNLVQACVYFHWKLASPAKNILKKLATSSRYRPMLKGLLAMLSAKEKAFLTPLLNTN